MKQALNIIHLVSNPVWGGGERYVLDLCKALRADGHSVAVITRGKQAVDARFAEAGFTPGKLPLHGRLDLISPLVLARVLNRIDGAIIVHAHNFKDADTAVRARRLMRDGSKVRVVVTRHLVKAASTGSYARDLYNSIDHIIFVSQAARNGFMSSAPKVDASRLHVVHNAVALPAAAVPSAKGDTIKLCFAGRLDPEKGVDTLLKAFAATSGTTLTIAGTGRARYVGELMQLTSRLGISDRVEYPGYLADVAPLYAASHIGVIPSVVAEAFPLTALEMMAHGLPVVASDAGGLRETVIDGVTGFLVPPGDEHALAARINELVTDPALRTRMAEAARQRAAEFTYDRFYKAITDIYSGNGR